MPIALLFVSPSLRAKSCTLSTALARTVNVIAVLEDVVSEDRSTLVTTSASLSSSCDWSDDPSVVFVSSSTASSSSSCVVSVSTSAVS